MDPVFSVFYILAAIGFVCGVISIVDRYLARRRPPTVEVGKTFYFEGRPFRVNQVEWTRERTTLEAENED